MKERYDLLIVGGGIAGMTAAIYAARARMDYLLLDAYGFGGGQIINTDRVENYPGLFGVSGGELGQTLEEHCKALGISIHRGTVSRIEQAENGLLVQVEDAAVLARAVIYAAGATHRKLEVPGEEALKGRGVSYCASCDGAFFRGKDVAVVGSGDTALSDALYLAKQCRRVHLLFRKERLKGAKILQERIKEHENILLHPVTTVTTILGENQVEKLEIVERGEGKELPVSGVFVAVGIRPNTEAVRELTGCGDGFLEAEEDCKTAVPGLFAAGDVREKRLHQLVTAAADGANALYSAESYLRETIPENRLVE